MANKIKVDDRVLVISGRDKGKTGSVIRVVRTSNRVVVEGVNIVTRHVRQRPGVSQAGLVQGEAPISVSNVLLIDPDTLQPGRVGWKFLEDDSRTREVKGKKNAIE